uniref:Uncharacterized protein n=1 Tax=Anopheles dirus TaxID=7168 RepID=A0A182NWI7_9DIPT
MKRMWRDGWWMRCCNCVIKMVKEKKLNDRKTMKKTIRTLANDFICTSKNKINFQFSREFRVCSWYNFFEKLTIVPPFCHSSCTRTRTHTHAHTHRPVICSVPRKKTKKKQIQNCSHPIARSASISKGNEKSKVGKKIYIQNPLTKGKLSLCGIYRNPAGWVWGGVALLSKRKTRRQKNSVQLHTDY